MSGRLSYELLACGWHGHLLVGASSGLAGPAVSSRAGSVTLPLRGRPLRDRYVLRHWPGRPSS
jgi:hypothetical protein